MMRHRRGQSDARVAPVADRPDAAEAPEIVRSGRHIGELIVDAELARNQPSWASSRA
jgi:hypothetical protein